MNFHVLTLFPDMIRSGVESSILGRALSQNLIQVNTMNIRDFTENKHHKVDDYPYGGGAGMLMQAQPVFDACRFVTEQIRKQAPLADARQDDQQGGERRPRVIYLTPQGKTLNQSMAMEFSTEEDLILLCGHYEGIDERVLEEVVTDYVSVGDYVLTGGELGALILIDCVSRLVPGVLHNQTSAETESFDNDLLEYPHYSRPEVWREKKVPEVLLSGDHKKIMKWRLEQSIEKTKNRRPDLYQRYAERQSLAELLKKKDKVRYMDMIETLRRGNCVIKYHGEEGCIIRDDAGELYLFALFDENRADHFLNSIYLVDWVDSSDSVDSGGSAGSIGSADTADTADTIGKLAVNWKWKFVLHHKQLFEAMKRRFVVEWAVPCMQAVYTKREQRSLKKDVEFKVLSEEDIDTVMEHYHMVPDREYIQNRISAGKLFGIFTEGKIAGFAGIHQEGSLGMLEILPEYRRRGYAEALESFLINEQLRADRVPYCHILSDNEASLALQEKMGFRISEKDIFWIGVRPEK